MVKTHLVFSKEQIVTFTKTFTLYNALVIGIPFIVIWGADVFEQVKDIVELLLNEGVLAYLWVFLKIYLWIMAGLLGGIVVHELLHALTFMLFARKGFKSVEFGFVEKPFIPYVHCKETLPLWAYRISVMMPGVVLGIIPCIIGLWLGSFYWVAFGIIFTSSAAGDFLLLKATKGIDPQSKIKDLPDQMGFEVSG